jgi:hypothetical protein
MKNQKTQSRIKWKNIEVKIERILPTPVNYKIATALGRERLKQSLKSYGLASSVTCNWDKKVNSQKLYLIDGNSRLQEEKEQGSKKIWVAVPDRVLTPKEFKEMSAMFDFAKAGEIDTERIEGDLGKSKDFYEKWNLTMPKSLLDKVGARKVEDYQKEKAEKKKQAIAKSSVADEQNLNDIVVVQLFFSNKQSDEFRKHEERLMKKFKTRTTTETVLMAYKALK